MAASAKRRIWRACTAASANAAPSANGSQPLAISASEPSAANHRLASRASAPHRVRTMRSKRYAHAIAESSPASSGESRAASGGKRIEYVSMYSPPYQLPFQSARP